MSSAESHCRLCAKPSARSRLACVDDEVIEIKQKMLLVNVDVSAPSPLPRGVCYSCLYLLEKTATFLAQVSAAQDKLAEIYLDNKHLVEESDNMSDDFEFGVKEEPQEDEGVEIKTELCRDELPEETELESRESLDNPVVKQKRGRPKNNISHKKSDNILQPLDTAVTKKKRVRPRKESKINEASENEPSEISKKEKKKDKPKCRKGRKVVTRNYSCHCGKVWPTPSLLKTHQKIHSERTRNFYCHICGKSYMDGTALRGHLLTHDDKRFKCEVCGKSFHTSGKLKRHSTQHSTERPFTCDQCGKSFAQKRHLKFHSAVHSDLRPYVCTYCHKQFKTKMVFEVHVRMHTGVRPYCCEHCGKDYFDHASLYKHVQSVHGADPRRRKPVDNNSEEFRNRAIADLMLQNN